MLSILGSLFPVFGLIVLGFALGRMHVFDETLERSLTRFVSMLTLPVLTFHTIAVMEPADMMAPIMVAVVVGASWLVYAMHFLVECALRQGPLRANVTALGGAYGNSAFVGLPLCLALFGPDALAPSALVMALNTAFVFGLGIFVQAFVSQTSGTVRDGLRSTGRRLATNPLVVGAALGVLASLSGLPMPPPVDRLMVTLGGATAGCALIAIGLFVSRPLSREVGPGVIRAAVAKLMLLPLTTLGLIMILPPMPPVWQATALIMAMVPTATSTFFVPSQSDRDAGKIAATLITATAIGALVTIPALIASLSALELLRV